MLRQLMTVRLRSRRADLPCHRFYNAVHVVRLERRQHCEQAGLMRRGSRLEGPQIVAGASHPHPDGKEDPSEYAALHIKVREYY